MGGGEYTGNARNVVGDFDGGPKQSEKAVDDDVDDEVVYECVEEFENAAGYVGKKAAQFGDNGDNVGYEIGGSVNEPSAGCNINDSKLDVQRCTADGLPQKDDRPEGNKKFV